MTELTMVVPNLVSLGELAMRDAVRWPVTNRVMASGARMDSPGPAGAGYARSLGLADDVGGLARYSFMHDTGRDPLAGCTRLDPVELGVGPRGLFLRCACMEDLRQDEADALVREIEPLMSEFGWHLQAPVPSRWYVLADRPLRMGLGPPVMAEGESLMQRLAGNESGREWARLLNEIQVLLHQHPVNQQRERDGRPQANCLWPWGGGPVARLDAAGPVRLWSDGDAVLGGISRVLGVEVQPADNLAQVQLGLRGATLISLASPGAAERRLDTLERHWLGPLARCVLPPWRFTLSDLDGRGYRMGWLDWWLGRRKPVQSEKSQ